VGKLLEKASNLTAASVRRAIRLPMVQEDSFRSGGLTEQLLSSFCWTIVWATCLKSIVDLSNPTFIETLNGTAGLY
jgi:hypothetical protein